jgi:hypothetical protein
MQGLFALQKERYRHGGGACDDEVRIVEGPLGILRFYMRKINKASLLNSARDGVQLLLALRGDLSAALLCLLN